MATFVKTGLDHERIPCRYYTFGCDVMLLGHERLVHQEMCIYKYCGCPYPAERCKWQGRTVETADHLMTVHRLTQLRGPNCGCPLRVLVVNDNYRTMSQYCFNLHFLLVLKKRANRHGVNWFYAASQLIGTRTRAVAFRCRMEMIRFGGSVSWEGRPRAIEDDLSMPADEFEFFIFSNETALMYAKDNELHIKVTITMLE